jgi:hypothetical protein
MPTPVKYPQLLDKAWVLEQLKTMSIAQLAKEVGCARSSVAWVYERYLSNEERAGVKKERIHKPKQDKILKVTKETENG